jgi:YVTN family beta-propeller protein
VGVPVAAGDGPQSIDISPDGRHAYVANTTSDDVSALVIDAGTGALSPVGPALPAGDGPVGIAVTNTSLLLE